MPCFPGSLDEKSIGRVRLIDSWLVGWLLDENQSDRSINCLPRWLSPSTRAWSVSFVSLSPLSGTSMIFPLIDLVVVDLPGDQ
jgi:hypothetical protein